MVLPKSTCLSHSYDFEENLSKVHSSLQSRCYFSMHKRCIKLQSHHQLMMNKNVSHWGLLGCDDMQCCCRIPMFQKTLLEVTASITNQKTLPWIFATVKIKNLSSRTSQFIHLKAHDLLTFTRKVVWWNNGTVIDVETLNSSNSIWTIKLPAHFNVRWTNSVYPYTLHFANNWNINKL